MCLLSRELLPKDSWDKLSHTDDRCGDKAAQKIDGWNFEGYGLTIPTVRALIKKRIGLNVLKQGKRLISTQIQTFSILLYPVGQTLFIILVIANVTLVFVTLTRTTIIHPSIFRSV